MESCTISIIIPVYNEKEQIEVAVNSVFEQEYENIEVILVDDGSTDGSSEICDRIAHEEKRVTVIHQPNGGG